MTTTVKPVPEGSHTVTTSLTLKDSRKAVEFYTQAFGAKVLGLFPMPDGKGTMHAMIQIGDSQVMLGDEMPGPGSCQSAESLGACPISLYLYVPNVDAAFKQAVEAGATVTMPVAEAFWGDRCGMVKDPFGYSWTIATHTRDLSPEQVQQGAREFFAHAGRRH